MKPALFTYPFVSSYPVMMLLGFVFGWVLTRRRARAYQIASSHIDNLALLLPLAGLAGARFFARLFYAKLPLLDALKVWKGDGLVFYGGFILSAGTVLLYARLRHLKLTRVADCFAPAAALGLAFGRVGCFLGGCCWGDVCVGSSDLAGVPPVVVAQIWTVPSMSGREWPFAVRFPAGSDPQKQHAKLGLVEGGASLPVHPVQLYEAVLAAGLAGWLHLRFRRPTGHRPGSTALALLIGYAVIRFLTEYLRADNKIYALGFTVSQLISMEILAVAGALLIVRRLLHSWSPPAPTAIDAPMQELPSSSRA